MVILLVGIVPSGVANVFPLIRYSTGSNRFIQRGRPRNSAQRSWRRVTACGCLARFGLFHWGFRCFFGGRRLCRGGRRLRLGTWFRCCRYRACFRLCGWCVAIGFWGRFFGHLGGWSLVHERRRGVQCNASRLPNLASGQDESYHSSEDEDCHACPYERYPGRLHSRCWFAPRPFDYAVSLTRLTR